MHSHAQSLAHYLPLASGKLYFFRYTFDAAPYATAGVLDAAGSVEREIPLDLPR